jgi:hypothetical protein
MHNIKYGNAIDTSSKEKRKQGGDEENDIISTEIR